MIDNSTRKELENVKLAYTNKIIECRFKIADIDKQIDDFYNHKIHNVSPKKLMDERYRLCIKINKYRFEVNKIRKKIHPDRWWGI